MLSTQIGINFTSFSCATLVAWWVRRGLGDFAKKTEDADKICSPSARSRTDVDEDSIIARALPRSTAAPRDKMFTSESPPHGTHTSRATRVCVTSRILPELKSLAREYVTISEQWSSRGRPGSECKEQFTLAQSQSVTEGTYAYEPEKAGLPRKCYIACNRTVINSLVPFDNLFAPARTDVRSMKDLPSFSYYRRS